MSTTENTSPTTTDEDLMERVRDMLRQVFGKGEEREALERDPEAFLAKYDVQDVTPHQIDECVAEMAPAYEQGGYAYRVPNPPASYPPAEQVSHHIIHHQETIVREYGDWTYIDQSSDTYIDQSVEVGDITNYGDGTVDLDLDQNAADDGAVVVGADGEVEGDIVTGDGNTIDESQEVDVVAAFGENVNVATDGDATQTVDDSQNLEANLAIDSPGAALNTGEEATVDAGNELNVDLGGPDPLGPEHHAVVERVAEVEPADLAGPADEPGEAFE